MNKWLDARAKAPVFVLGAPRSGTTFLYDTILSSGNFAVFKAESDVFSVIAPAFGDLRSRHNRARMMDAWLKSDHFKRTGLDAEEIRAAVLAECRSAGDFLRITMECVAQQQGVERWADNTPAHLLYIPQIKAAFPDALFIHILRDGRDVATSWDRIGWPAEHGRFPWDRGHGLLVCAACWEWTVRKGRQMARGLGPNYLEVHYEDLVRRPRETLRTLGEFIQHDLDYDRIQRNAVGTVRTPNTSFYDAPSDEKTKTVGRWKNLKGPDVERMEAMLAPLLRELGYPANASARMDFTTWRTREFYSAFRTLKQGLKDSPFSRSVVCRDKLGDGYLDRQASRWRGTRVDTEDRYPSN